MGYLSIDNLYKSPEIIDLFRECYALEKVHGCLHEDSSILMADGSNKPIKDILPGEFIKTYNLDKQEFTVQKVLDVVVQQQTDQLAWYQIDLPNGRTLVCTEDHPILTKRGWIQAKDLQLEDDLISI